jgi:hypothetical protein
MEWGMNKQPDGHELNRYAQIIERIFFRHYQEGIREVPFEREELVHTAQELGINVPLNLGDIMYSFRYRQQLPDSIEKHYRLVQPDELTEEELRTYNARPIEEGTFP